MRLLQSVRTHFKQTKKPQHKSVAYPLRLVVMLPGHAICRHLSRYSPYHEQLFSQWCARAFDGVWLNQSAISEVVPPEHDQALIVNVRPIGSVWKHPARTTRRFVTMASLPMRPPQVGTK